MSCSDLEVYTKAWNDIQASINERKSKISEDTKSNDDNLFKKPKVSQIISHSTPTNHILQVDKDAILSILESDDDMEASNHSLSAPKDRTSSDEHDEVVIVDVKKLPNDKIKPTGIKKSRKKKIRFSCSICEKYFFKRINRQQHEFKVHGSTAPKCETCGRTFSTRQKLSRHKATHEDRQCQFCSNKYSTYSELRTHVSVDHVKIVSCTLCDQSFRHRQLLRKHMKVHRTETDRLPCPYKDCPRSYTTKTNLTVHVRNYHEGRRYPCTIEGCTFTLSTKQKLTHHIRLHTLQRVLPTHSRGPRNDKAMRMRKQRKAEETRLIKESKRQEIRKKTLWWERSDSATESSCVVDSDNSVSKYLREEKDKKSMKRKRRRKRRRRKESEVLTTDESGVETSLIK